MRTIPNGLLTRGTAKGQISCILTVMWNIGLLMITGHRGLQNRKGKIGNCYLPASGKRMLALEIIVNLYPVENEKVFSAGQKVQSINSEQNKG